MSMLGPSCWQAHGSMRVRMRWWLGAESATNALFAFLHASTALHGRSQSPLPLQRTTIHAASPLEAAHGLTSKKAGMVALDVNPHGRVSLVSTTMKLDCSASARELREMIFFGPCQGNHSAASLAVGRCAGNVLSYGHPLPRGARDSQHLATAALLSRF